MDKIRLTVMLVIWVTLALCVNAQAQNKSSQNDTKQQQALPEDDELIQASYILPKTVFNEGKPFYLEKDPISGALDFSSKKASPVQPSIPELNPQHDKDISLSTNDIRIAPNIHDYLNLPVKYTSSKFVYPLVSSSYANLKYQGNNKNFISNHKNASTITIPTNPTSATGGQSYYPRHPPQATPKLPSPTTTNVPATSYKPTVPVISSSTVRVTSTERLTERPATEYTKQPNKYTTSNKFTKYSTIRKRPIISTTTKPVPTKSQSFMDIFFGGLDDDYKTDEYDYYDRNETHLTTTTGAPNVTTTVVMTSLGTKLPTPFTPVANATKLPAVTTTTTTTTVAASSSSLSSTAGYTPTTPVPSTTTAFQPKYSTTSAPPVTQFKPLPISQNFGSVDAADVYNSMSNKFNKAEAVVNSDKINSLDDGHLEAATKVPSTKKPLVPNSEPFKIFNGNPNDYVKYEIQSPTTFNKFKPAPPASMNNIVISPGQDSATFVLGSQQSVGGSAGVLQVGSPHKGDGDKSKDSNVYQMGNVFNDNAYGFSRPQGFTMASTEATIVPVVKENTLKGSVRFPADTFENAPIVTGTFSSDVNRPNGHSAPVALPHSQMVVFPPNSQSATASVGSGSIQVGAGPSQNRVVFSGNEKIEDKNQVYAQREQQQIQAQQQMLQHQQQQQQQQYIQSQQEQHQLMNSQQQQPQQQENQRPQQQTGFQHQNQDGGSHSNFPSDNLHPPGVEYNQRLPSSRPAQDFGPRPSFNRQPNPHQQNEFNRNQPNQRPLNADPNLPNILPQFRPNAKISQGHSYNKEAGNINLRPPQPNYRPNAHDISIKRMQVNPNIRPPLPNHLGFRRNGPPANKFNPKMGPPPHPDTLEGNNRRFYMVPPMITDRIYNHPPPSPSFGGPPPRRYIDGYPAIQRASHPESVELKSELPPQPKPHQSSYPVVDSIPEQVSTGKRDVPPKLEPVVTLQMIQSQKQLAPSEQGLLKKYTQENVPVAVQTASDKPPVYVVYPVKTSPLKLDVVSSEEDETVVIGHRGEQPPLPPSDIEPSVAGGNEYQNTPFTVVRHEQEPILKQKHIVKEKGGSFPYALEKPNNFARDEINAHLSNHEQSGEYPVGTMFNFGAGPSDIASRVVNRGSYTEDNANSAVTDTPIAIAYTPTDPTRYYNRHEQFSMPNYASPVISEIRDTQTESPYKRHDNVVSKAPNRGEHLEQDFQAPFYPSDNLEGVTPSKNGWSVITTPASRRQENKIDRVDLERGGSDESGEEMVTKKFDINEFKPELQGGFLPIVPSNKTPVKVEPASGELKSTRPQNLEDSIEALVYDDDVKSNEEEDDDDEEESSTSS